MAFDFSLVPTATLFIMMMALGMELRIEDFVRIADAPAAPLIGIVGQLLLLPMVAFAIAMTIPMASVTALGIILIAACPGGATSNMFSRYANGDVALSISLTAVSSLASPLTVALIIGLGFRFIGDEETRVAPDPWEMIRTLVMATVVPVLLGMSWLRFHESSAMRWRGRLLGTASAILVILVIGLAVNTARIQGDVIGMFARSGLAVILLMAITASSAWFLARALGLTIAQGRTLVLEVGVQNINMALVIALNILEESSYLGPALVYMPLMLVFGGTVILASKYQRKGGAALGSIGE